MSEFSELVKRFDKIRSYVRDFYVYGFKTREDYQEKSSRTYDNERRRIESWFSDYVKSDYNKEKKKAVAISIDSSQIPVNPLYHAWKSKSFTSNDIMLHFFITDLLKDGIGQNVEEITDQILNRYHVVFDSQTVRNKLIKYQQLGILSVKKTGKQHIYSLNPDLEKELPDEYRTLLEAVCFFQAAAPFGFVGSTILDNQHMDNKVFRMKHDVLVHTLEDEILLSVLEAVKNQQMLRLEIKGSKSKLITRIDGTPLKILVSTQTGRRYICIHNRKSRRFHSIRLDTIQSVKAMDVDTDFSRHLQALKRNLNYCWGVSFGSGHEPEEVSFILAFDEVREAHIINRMEREGRGGTVTRLEKNLYKYHGSFWDVNELLPWVKTFTGKIVSFQCSNSFLEKKLLRDLKRMEELYGKSPDQAEMRQE